MQVVLDQPGAGQYGAQCGLGTHAFYGFFWPHNMQPGIVGDKGMVENENGCQ